MERVEVLDLRGAVIDVVPREVMRASNLRHRTVYVVVLHGDRLLVHQRAGWKDVWPSRWDIAFGGVCRVGESWPDAAIRELNEEVGCLVDESDLLDLGDGWFDSDEVRVVGRIYAIQHAGPFVYADGEVEATEWVTVPSLPEWLGRRDVCDDSIALIVPRLLAD